jgi:hypothetical protein
MEINLREIDPNDPIYKGLTKSELRVMKYLSLEDKETEGLR